MQASNGPFSWLFGGLGRLLWLVGAYGAGRQRQTRVPALERVASTSYWGNFLTRRHGSSTMMESTSVTRSRYARTPLLALA
jgi:hypothetical protein